MITVFIPTFNEELNVELIPTELIPVLKNLNEDFEVLIVDDGSLDKTVDKINRLKKDFKEINLVRHGSNKGLGYAVRTGILNAKGDIFIPLDADFTFHPRYIPELVQFMKENESDCVIGSPFLQAKDHQEIAFQRLLLSRVINKVYNILLRNGISASTSIFRVYLTSQLKNIELTSQGYAINAEILFNLVRNKRKICELATPLLKRAFGESKMNYFSESIDHLNVIYKIILWRITKCLAN